MNIQFFFADWTNIDPSKTLMYNVCTINIDGNEIMRGKWTKGQDEFKRDQYLYDGGYIESLLVGETDNLWILIKFTNKDHVELPGSSGEPCLPFYRVFHEKDFTNVLEQIDKIAPLPPQFKEEIEGRLGISKSETNESGFGSIFNFFLSKDSEIAKSPNTNWHANLKILRNANCDVLEEMSNQINLFFLRHKQDPIQISKHIFSYLEYNFPLKSNELKQSLDMISNFLTRTDNLLMKSGRVSVARELLKIVLTPEFLNQGLSNLCGVDILIRELAHRAPAALCYLGIELAEKGEVHFPFEIKLPTIQEEQSIITVILSAIRNSSNSPLIGYSLNEKSELFESITGSSWESFRGLTLPKDLEVWFKSFGFNVVHDDLQIIGDDWKELNPLHRFALGGLYSNKHENIEPDQRIKNLQKFIEDKSLGINLLISPAFTRYLSGVLNGYEIFDTVGLTTLGGQVGHYVKLTHFLIEKDGSLTFDLNTWGDTYKIRNMPSKIFDRHCFGTFITQFKGLPFDLNQPLEKEEPQFCTLI